MLSLDRTLLLQLMLYHTLSNNVPSSSSSCMRTEVHYTQVYSNSAAFSGIDLSPVLSISSDASSRYLEFTGPMGAGMLQRDATTGGDTCGRTSANSAV